MLPPEEAFSSRKSSREFSWPRRRYRYHNFTEEFPPAHHPHDCCANLLSILRSFFTPPENPIPPSHPPFFSTFLQKYLRNTPPGRGSIPDCIIRTVCRRIDSSSRGPIVLLLQDVTPLYLFGSSPFRPPQFPHGSGFRQFDWY